MNNRITYIDYVKTIGIFLVVLGHQPITNITLHDWIFSFHMPLFFFISGFLVKAELDNKKFFKNNLRSLIVVILPYFIISLVFGAVQDYVFYREDFSLQHNLTEKMERTFLGQSKMGVMWFLVALFWMRIAYNWGLQLVKEHTYGVLFIMSIIVATIAHTCDMKMNYYQITAFILGFPFYCCGALMKRINFIETIRLRKYAIPFSIFFLSASVLILKYAGSINLNDLDIGNNIVLYYLSGITGTLFIIAFGLLLPKNRIIETISSGTLVILGLHMMLIQIFKLFYKKIYTYILPPPPPIWIVYQQ